MGKTTLLLSSHSSASLGQVLPGVTSGGLTMLAPQVRKLGLREFHSFSPWEGDIALVAGPLHPEP